MVSIQSIKNSVVDYFRNCYAFSSNLVGEPTGQSAVDTVLGLVITGIVLVIGVFIFGEVSSHIETENNGTLDNVIGDLEGAYGMTPILLIVLVAAAIIGILMRFRRRPE